MKLGFFWVLFSSALLASCGQNTSAPNVATTVSPPVSTTPGFMQGFAPQLDVVREGSLAALGLQPVKVLRSHKFSDGKIFNYTTVGSLVIDDDMVLGTTTEFAEAVKSYEEKLKNPPVKTQGIMVDYCTSSFLFWCTARDGVRWPDSAPGVTVVYYEPPVGFTPAEISVIQSAMYEIQRHPNTLFFQESATATNRIRFTTLSGTDTGGCYSAIGFKGGVQTLNLDTKCRDRQTVIHELLHALGVVHELQRPDRDKSVTINTSNLTPLGLQNVSFVYGSTAVSQSSYTFDLFSIMIYPKFTTDTRYVINTSQPIYSIAPIYELLYPNIVPGPSQLPTADDLAVLDARY